ncbi:MAG: nitroreductase family protein [Candidatus Methanoperedens nitroreducens]|uniref:Nitroreductase family protein n=1 Tax=Candidatus Methanoperedens nitratireducens TaxID=1392998 RepID=A0A0N8KR50_9EURY|nr:nitroreductase family protein [Candidatus Methanoperedens sp. BLZ2]KAB2945877.1 MAG: nitroreductase [Candidatus Methanoperedens sp.]KPQ43954.1 MAG: nitroreductase family protein [Candidatus Methanoperedens sp. BLZ1]MBZ0174327.1 nitroreductase family protein [Candidatus Methanoperedens nitroreducens]MCX9079861.1 nitroreductase family protein [Candidatus Methanoperedens sp.]
MDVKTAIRTRRSIRAYDPREVEEEKLVRVLESGRLSPSASNRQERRFIVIRDAVTRKALSVAARNQKFLADAPVVIAACSVEKEYVMSCGQLAYPIDTAIAVDHMTLAAVEEGLGTCWIGAFDEKKVKEILNIPDEIRVVTLLPVGYPSDIPRPTPRKSLDEIVLWETWRI